MTRPASESCDSAAASSWAEKMVAKWDPDHSPYASVPCIFHESRDEARRFLSAVHELQVLAASQKSSSTSASAVIEPAMRRLQRELCHMLHSTTSDSYGPLSDDCSSDEAGRDSSSDDDNDEFFPGPISVYGDDLRNPRAASMSYLRSIADCMVSAGYIRHCAAIYVACRREAVQDALRRLGIDPRASRVSNNVLSLLDAWLAASRAAVRVVFSRERVLCDTVFGSVASVAESCFAEVVNDAAVEVLIRFPRSLAGKKIKARARVQETVPSTAHPAEKALFGLLEVHGTLNELMPELETMFSGKATIELLDQACASRQKVEKAVRDRLADLELSIRKDSQGKNSSSSRPPGGGLHPLAIQVVSLLSSLADHTSSLSHILSKNESTRGSSPLNPRSPTTTPSSDSVAGLFEWLLTVLLCKLDVKAELYRDPSISYLFLANNLRYITSQIRANRALLALLGTEWADVHEQKARRFTASHLRHAWAKVTAGLPADLGEAAAQMESPGGVEVVVARVREFNVAFDAACVSLAGCVVPDDTIRDELRRWAAEGVVGPYRAFYGLCRRALSSREGLVRFAPEDVMARLAGLYSGTGSSSSGCSSNGSSSSSSASGSGSSKGRKWPWGG